MMPDLGKYAFSVLLAYGAGLGLLLAIVALSVWQARRSARALAAGEARAAAADEGDGRG
jgi:heme exporter protein D